MQKPKCDEIGFAHAWEHPAIGREWAPGIPLRDERTRVCQNCGKRQVSVYVGTTTTTPGNAIAIFEWRDEQ